VRVVSANSSKPRSIFFVLVGTAYLPQIAASLQEDEKGAIYLTFRLKYEMVEFI